MSKKGYTKHTYFSVEETTELVEKAKKGDQRSTTKLFKKFKPIMYSLIKKAHPYMSHEELEDEVLIFLGRIFGRDIAKFDRSKAQFSTWLTYCFRMHIINISRKKKRVITNSIEDMLPDDRVWSIEDESQSPERFAENIPFKKLARMLINTLGPKLARLIIMRHWYGEDAKVCEDATGHPRGSYKYYERKAFSKINGVLDKDDFLN